MSKFSPTSFAIGALATYRITKFILDDELIATPREKFQEKFPPDSTLLGYLSTCPWCVSIYAGVATLALPESARAALAFSAVTGAAVELSDGRL